MGSNKHTQDTDTAKYIRFAAMMKETRRLIDHDNDSIYEEHFPSPGARPASYQIRTTFGKGCETIRNYTAMIDYHLVRLKDGQAQDADGKSIKVEQGVALSRGVLVRELLGVEDARCISDAWSLTIDDYVRLAEACDDGDVEALVVVELQKRMSYVVRRAVRAGRAICKDLRLYPHDGQTSSYKTIMSNREWLVGFYHSLGLVHGERLYVACRSKKLAPTGTVDEHSGLIERLARKPLTGEDECSLALCYLYGCQLKDVEGGSRALRCAMLAVCHRPQETEGDLYLAASQSLEIIRLFFMACVYGPEGIDFCLRNADTLSFTHAFDRGDEGFTLTQRLSADDPGAHPVRFDASIACVVLAREETATGDVQWVNGVGMQERPEDGTRRFVPRSAGPTGICDLVSNPHARIERDASAGRVRWLLREDVTSDGGRPTNGTAVLRANGTLKVFGPRPRAHVLSDGDEIWLAPFADGRPDFVHGACIQFFTSRSISYAPDAAHLMSHKTPRRGAPRAVAWAAGEKGSHEGEMPVGIMLSGTVFPVEEDAGTLALAGKPELVVGIGTDVDYRLEVAGQISHHHGSIRLDTDGRAIWTEGSASGGCRPLFGVEIVRQGCRCSIQVGGEGCGTKAAALEDGDVIYIPDYRKREATIEFGYLWESSDTE